MRIYGVHAVFLLWVFVVPHWDLGVSCAAKGFLILQTSGLLKDLNLELLGIRLENSKKA